MAAVKKIVLENTTLEKVKTGIKGFDEITAGGLPKGRITLICGSAGAGKTLFATEFVVRGATSFGEPAVIMTFEEQATDLEKNVASLGFNLPLLQQQNLLRIDYVHVERSEIEETGEYDLTGLFIRLGHAIDSIGAKRVVLDTIENLFGGLSNEGVLRAELRRLFNWLKEKGVTAVITAEKGDGTLTRHGLEEYVSDCVIVLDHRVNDQISTRRLRVVKYRGSTHGTNEYPFLIDSQGFSVLPITSLDLNHEVTSERIQSGVAGLDQMLQGDGFFRGSSILVSGTAGTGKTSLAASFADAACKRGEKCLFFAFEESPKQIIRNMKSIGLDLQKHIDAGMLRFHAARPSIFGLEMHLLTIHNQIEEFNADFVVIDPISNLMTNGLLSEVKSVLIRLIDLLQSKLITVVFTTLNLQTHLEQYDESVSSLVDAWITIKEIETDGERNKALFVVKSRGMNHSNQIREFVISDEGLKLIDVYAGEQGILVGSARESHEIRLQTTKEMRKHANEQTNKEIDRKRMILEARIASLNEKFISMQHELKRTFADEELKEELMEKNRRNSSAKRTDNANNKKK
jgi:circadian clock protein KaiC